MELINAVDLLIAHIKNWKLSGLSIAFVPTMGNLHSGHLKLVNEAKLKADKVVVSIFVNPTQFGAGEDFESYPRTEHQDAEQLIAQGVDILFLPTVGEIYHPQVKTVISVASLSDLHCGLFRPGHFDGVATVVCKLFNMVQPNVALFGEKDFQQLAIIRTMVRDLNIPVQIHSVATVREADGLAMSSRNGYLTKEQRLFAPKLYQALCQARDAVITRQLSYTEIEQQQTALLQQLGFKVDYFAICRANDLLPAKFCDNEIVILAAAKLGKPRLIDNIHFKINKLTVDSL
jgi:pantoate--beta-alanine ligase